jgi:superfamily II DNA or RNA helicase
MKTLRDYQEDLSRKAVEILKDKGIVYLAMEVRCGKTATAMNTALLYGARRVLFLTKKKAISSIEDDLNEFGFDEFFDIFTITNDESLHKVEDDYDLVIHDEHHRFGAFPKMGATAKLFRQKYSHLPMIFLSGTPHPESYSQVFPSIPRVEKFTF